MLRRHTLSLVAILALAVLLQLQGCAGTRPMEAGGTPGSGRAVIVYGIRVDSPWRAPQFQVALDAYDVREGALEIDCWGSKRTLASVPGVPDSTKYFSFEVSPGDYVYGGWGRELRGGSKYFSVLEGQVAYVGEFVYTQDNDVELIQNLEAARPNILAALPKTPKEMSLARSGTVGTIRGYLCAP